MRTTTLLLCLGLGVSLSNCAGANAAHDASEPALEPAATEPAPPPARAVHTAATRKKSEKNSDEPKEDWWKEGGITREKINAMCWMKFEKGRKDISVDKRADLVNDCVQQTLKEHPLQ